MQMGCKKPEESHKESENRVNPVLQYLLKLKETLNYWSKVRYSEFQTKCKENDVHYTTKMNF